MPVEFPDAEVEAIRTCALALEELHDRAAALRAIAYLADRFGAAIAAHWAYTYAARAGAERCVCGRHSPPFPEGHQKGSPCYVVDAPSAKETP